MSFETDTQGQNTQLYPIVTIEPPDAVNRPHYEVLDTECIFLSTNNVSLDHVHSLNNPNEGRLFGRHFKPILLNIPHIKESIDITSRKFKISNINLDISNYEYGGKRFSDMLHSETSLLNWKVSIQFVSPSAKLFSTIFAVSGYPSQNYASWYEMYSGLDASLTASGGPYMTKMVYQGVIRRINHDNSIFRIEVEDLSEKKFHKNLPRMILPSTDNMLDKYKNKPIPMVYGKVEKSPVVIDGSSGGYKIRIDSRPLKFMDVSIDVISETFEYPLYLLQDDIYYSVYEEIVKKFDWAGPDGYDLQITPNDTQQYTYSDDYSYIDLLSANPLLTHNALQVKYVGVPKVIDLRKLEGVSLDTQYSTGDSIFTEAHMASMVDGNLNTSASIALSTGIQGVNLTLTTEAWLLGGHGLDFGIIGNFIESTINRLVINGIVIPEDDITTGYYGPVAGSTGESGAGGVGEFTIELLSSNTYYNQLLEMLGQDESLYTGSNKIVMVAHPTIEVTPFGSVAIYGGASFFKISQEGSMFSIHWSDFSTISDNPNFISWIHQMDSQINVKEISMSVIADIDDPLSNLFFVNVQGRVNNVYGESINYHLGYGELIVNPIDIIYDLVKAELGHKAINEQQYSVARENHKLLDGTDWKFGFTITKETNSIKLIEDIAKSTKCFTTFNNDGTFGFHTIKDSYTAEGSSSDYYNARLIDESDAISYSFTKTKPENIYKRVDVKYKRDYASDAYMGKTQTLFTGQPTYIDDDDGTSIYKDDFYGIETSKDAHLDFKSDYIRDHDTATELSKFLSKQYENDHLVFKLKLPPKYINLNIGDHIKFRELLGGSRAHGIDYRRISIKNAQWRYPLFIVTSVKKNLDSVSIECMQLHHLSGIVEGAAQIWVWFDEAETWGQWQDVEPNSGWFNDHSEGDTFWFPTQENIIVNTPPILTIPDDITIPLGYGQEYWYQYFHPAYNYDISAYDAEDFWMSQGAITMDMDSWIETQLLDQTGPDYSVHTYGWQLIGSGVISYSVQDSLGSVSTKSLTVTVIPPEGWGEGELSGDVEGVSLNLYQGNYTLQPSINGQYAFSQILDRLQFWGTENIITDMGAYMEAQYLNWQNQGMTSSIFQDGMFLRIRDNFENTADFQVVHNTGYDTGATVTLKPVNLHINYQSFPNSLVNLNQQFGEPVEFGEWVWDWGYDEEGEYVFQEWFVGIEGNLTITQLVIPSIFHMGDVTLDGTINILDVIALVNHILSSDSNVYDLPELSDTALVLADINSDGSVNVGDVVALTNIILWN